MSELASLSVIIRGRVQGVFYRSFASNAAKTLGLKGYVCNLSNPDVVELHAEGDKDKLEELIKQLEIGPPGALVKKIAVNWSDYKEQFSDFEIRYY